jgi:hypothetical protein
MNRQVTGIALIGLGALIYAAGMFRWRVWGFTRQERRFRQEDGEESVFARRKTAGMTGMVLGFIVLMFGNF